MLNQKDNERSSLPPNSLIIVKDEEFKGLENLGRCWKYFLVPVWEDNMVTPSLVAEIIDWCLKKEEVIPANYKGEIVNNRHML